jgi:protein arginine kinase activator
MTCQRCHNEASVHLTERLKGQTREVHLCPSCARKAGLPFPDSAPNLALEAVVDSLIEANVGELVSELAELACAVCGMKFMEFRAGGMLGCPHDYQVFALGLAPLVQEYHGATRHVGKIARRSELAETRLEIRSRLRAAVLREDYEEAARLRDALRPKESHR